MFALYPKTSIKVIRKELSPIVTRWRIFKYVVTEVDSKITLQDFKSFWLNVREAEEGLRQSKPSKDTKVLLLEVRDPKDEHIRIENM